MAEFIIHRCTLRVVRRHGWSWGPGPERLLKAAVAALPLLIARKLGDLWLDEADKEITEKISLTVPIRLSELLELGAESASRSETVGPHSGGAFDERLTAAVKRAFVKELAALEVQARETRLTTVDSEAQRRDDQKGHDDRVLRLLLGWRRLGELEIHLASFSAQELEAWYAALCATITKLAVANEGVRPERVSQLIQELATRVESLGADRLAILRLRLLALLAVGERLHLQSIDEPSLEKTFDDVAAQFLQSENYPASGLARETEPELPFQSSVSLPVASRPAPPFIVPVPTVASPCLTKTEFNIRSVLPFLLLGPLSKIGYLEALAATLETIGLSSQAPLFATALAFKVLTPPARGWRRDDEDLTVAAAFAGVETVPPGEALTEFARKTSGHLSPLDSLVSHSLTKGHRPDSPMLLHRTREEDGPEGFLLVEMEGLFPLAWANDLQALMPALRYFSETHLLMQHASADVETLAVLNASGFRFLTDAPPTRGETWREIRRSPRERWYSNDIDGKPTALARTAAELTRAAEETELLWRALKVDRPAIATARHSELERSLTVAASLALGTISWALWKDRETVTPVLALERFGDLAGRVRFTPAAVEVRLSLGRRQRDLHEHGLLADVHDVPWLDGRKVEFLGG